MHTCGNVILRAKAILVLLLNCLPCSFVFNDVISVLFKKYRCCFQEMIIVLPEENSMHAYGFVQTSGFLLMDVT